MRKIKTGGNLAKETMLWTVLPSWSGKKKPKQGVCKAAPAPSSVRSLPSPVTNTVVTCPPSQTPWRCLQIKMHT